MGKRNPNEPGVLIQLGGERPYVPPITDNDTLLARTPKPAKAAGTKPGSVWAWLGEDDSRGEVMATDRASAERKAAAACPVPVRMVWQRGDVAKTFTAAGRGEY